MTNSVTPSLRSVCLPLVFLVLLAFSSHLWAHPLPDLPVRSHFDSEGTVEVRVELDPRSLEDDPEQFEYITPAEVADMSGEDLAELKKKASRFVEERLAFRFDPLGEVKPSFEWEWVCFGDKPVAPDDEDSIMVLAGSWKTKIADGISGYRLTSKELDPFKMGIPLNVVFFNFIDGVQAERYAVLFPGETSYTFDLTGLSASGPAEPAPDASGMKADFDDWQSLFVSEIRRGFRHVIPEGLDHILFVLGIFLMTRRWKPLILQVSAFTVAHTLTLWLASAGMVNIPATVVEPIIAASIAAVAIENIFQRKYTHWRLLVVLLFGLIHGLGFAGAMSTKVDSTTSLLVGLLGINIGVELGQLAVIATALILTAWIRDQERFRKFITIPGSILIALAGIWWVVERTFL